MHTNTYVYCSLQGPCFVNVMYMSSSTAAMYLRPAMKQFGNRLNVLTNALVTRIAFDKLQATGIEYFSNGQTKRAVATREVI